MNIVEQVLRARRAGTPIVAIETPDQVGVVRALQGLANGGKPIIVEWDCLRGLRATNEETVEAMSVIENPEDALDGTSAVLSTVSLPRKSVLCLHHADAALADNPAMVQALSTARDRLKSRGVMIALMGVHINIPYGLHHDVIRMRDPLPDMEQLCSIAENNAKSYSNWREKNGSKEPWSQTKEEIEKAASGMRGLSAFAAEQAAAVTIFEHGSFGRISTERNAAINAIPGLHVDAGGVKFNDMRGCERAREYMHRLCNGPEAPELILRIDEIEKKLSGTAGEKQNAGATGADELQVVLQAMEGYAWSGVIAFGHAGTAKTMWCQAVGPTFGIPSIELDLGSTRSKYVGESEQHIRNAIETVHTIGGNRVHVMATCNELAGLPPELRRRFTDGIVFFDLPSAEERVDMWQLYSSIYNVPDLSKFPDMEGLTGAEIRNICRLAYRMGVTLEEASKDVVPVCKADKEGVQRRRKSAHERYRSASVPGVYRMPGSGPSEDEGRDMG